MMRERVSVSSRLTAAWPMVTAKLVEFRWARLFSVMAEVGVAAVAVIAVVLLLLLLLLLLFVLFRFAFDGWKLMLAVWGS